MEVLNYPAHVGCDEEKCMRRYIQMASQETCVVLASLNTKMVYAQTVTHLSTNPAQCRATMLNC